MSGRSHADFAVAWLRALVVTVTAIAAPIVMAVGGGACAHEPPATVTAPNVARRSEPVRRHEPTAAAAESPAPTPPLHSSGRSAIFFDFDSAILRDDAHPELQRVAEEMQGRRGRQLRVEGNCDQLGTVEYNLALGEHRAEAAKQYLMRLGVPTDRIATVSYGSQRPRFLGDSEEERAKNRRDDFVIQ